MRPLIPDRSAPTRVIQASFDRTLPMAGAAQYQSRTVSWTAGAFPSSTAQPQSSVPPRTGMLTSGRPHSVAQRRADLPTSATPRGLERPDPLVPGPQRPTAYLVNPEILRTVLPDPGLPLPRVVLRKMETLLGADLSKVRVHTGPQAVRLGAVAFTSGHDIYFGPEQYQPFTPSGEALLIRHLTYVLQQRSGRARNPFGAGLAVLQDSALDAEAQSLRRCDRTSSPPGGTPRFNRSFMRAGTAQRAQIGGPEYIQDKDNSCWAKCLSLMLEHHKIQISENYLYSLYNRDIKTHEMAAIVKFLNKNDKVRKSGFEVKMADDPESPLLPFVHEMGPYVCAIPNHYILITEYDSEKGTVKYLDPLNGDPKEGSVEKLNLHHIVYAFK